MRSVISCLCLVSLAAFVAPVHAERSPIYPFDVKVGGQLAVHDGQPTSIFADIAEPVAADATFEVEVSGGMVIVNAFSIDEAGNPVPGVPPKVIVIQDGNSGSFSDTADGSVLEPGVYGMNVVAGGKTSRVRFTVAP